MNLASFAQNGASAPSKNPAYDISLIVLNDSSNSSSQLSKISAHLNRAWPDLLVVLGTSGLSHEDFTHPGYNVYKQSSLKEQPQQPQQLQQLQQHQAAYEEEEVLLVYVKSRLGAVRLTELDSKESLVRFIFMNFLFNCLSVKKEHFLSYNH